MAEQLVGTPPRFARESDQRLFLAVRRRLWEYEPLRATNPDLDVDVDRGRVRLTGRVRTLAMKEIAGYIVRRIEGVTTVVNDIISDTEVVRQVADVLASDDELGPLCLRIDARAGVATLFGDLPHAELEERAVGLARSAPGVADVVSELAVRRGEHVLGAPTAKADLAPEARTGDAQPTRVGRAQ